MAAAVTPVFVSHATEDRAIATELSEQLEARGVPTWLALRDIALGANFAREVAQSIARSDYMVVVLSEAAVNSPHVSREVNAAIDERVRLLPVLVDRSPDFVARLPADWKYWLSLVQVIPYSDAAAAAAVIAQQVNDPPEVTEVQFPPDRATAPAAPSRRRRAAWFLTAAAVLAALVAGGVFIANQRHSPEPSAQAPAPTVGAAPTALTASSGAPPTVEPAALTCRTGGPCDKLDKGPGGGTVFYVPDGTQDGGQYLEVAPLDWYEKESPPPTANWCLDDAKEVPGTAKEIGTGSANTQAMLDADCKGAALLATSYRGGGFDDWYLPSLAELELIWSDGSRNVGTENDPETYPYWTSTESSPKYAFCWECADQRGGNTDVKTNEHRVLPVRAFSLPSPASTGVPSND